MARSRDRQRGGHTSLSPGSTTPCGRGSSRCCRNRRESGSRRWDVPASPIAQRSPAFSSSCAPACSGRCCRWRWAAGLAGNTYWRRLVRWQRAGMWQRLHAALLAELRQCGQLDLPRAIVDVSFLPIVRHTLPGIGGQPFTPEWEPPVFGR